jgi:hypothetical protein
LQRSCFNIQPKCFLKFFIEILIRVRSSKLLNKKCRLSPNFWEERPVCVHVQADLLSDLQFRKIYEKCIICLEDSFGPAWEMCFSNIAQAYAVLISLLVFFSWRSRVQTMPMQADVSEEVEPNKTTAKNVGTFLKTPFTASIPRSGTQDREYT